MNYVGKLYARIGGKYFDTGITPEYFDTMKEENERYRKALEEISGTNVQDIKEAPLSFASLAFNLATGALKQK